MGAGEVRERRLPGEPVQCPAPPQPVQLLEPAREKHLRRCRVARCELLARRDEGLPAATNIGVLPQVRVGASHAAAIPPVDVGSGLHVTSLRCWTFRAAALCRAAWRPRLMVYSLAVCFLPSA